MSASASADVVIVGAGHAGVQLAVNLARLERPPSVVLLSGEAELPYERPPLTKALLYGDGAVSPIGLRSADYWRRSAIDLRLGHRVVSIDPARSAALTDGGVTVFYRRLVWAAGGHAAPCGLPGEQLRGVHSVRDFADLAGIRAELPDARAAAIIGGGYIGLEAAAALRRHGLAVTVLEAAPRLLARVTGETISAHLLDLHRSRGVDVRLGAGVAAIDGQNGRAVAVRLADGGTVAADVVIVGVGMRPNVEALLMAGAAGDTAGVDVDGSCLTSLPGVHAIGDCARQRNQWSSRPGPIRVESVHNASQHATTVARSIAGLPIAEPPPPRFWSTQYGQELKTVGLVSSMDEPVLRGDPATGQFSVAYLRQGRLTAIDTVNCPRDFARAQSLIAGGWQPTDRDHLADLDDELPRLTLSGRPG